MELQQMTQICNWKF